MVLTSTLPSKEAPTGLMTFKENWSFLRKGGGLIPSIFGYTCLLIFVRILCSNIMNPCALFLTIFASVLRSFINMTLIRLFQLISNALIKRATLKMQLAKVEECFEDFKKAVNMDKDNADVYHHRGQVNLCLKLEYI